MNWQNILITLLFAGLLFMYGIVMSDNVLSEETNSIIASDEVEVSKELEAALIEQELVRVIIGLNVEFKPEGELSTPHEVSEQQSRILAAQTQLINQIKDVVSLELGETLFSTIPFLSITANRTILNLLVDSPLVKTVQLDEMNSLSVPNNNGDD